MRVLHRFWCLSALFGLALLAVLLPASALARTAPVGASNQPFAANHPFTGGAVQDPAWVAAKLAGKVRVSPNAASIPNTCPTISRGLAPRGLTAQITPSEICPVYDTHLSTFVTGQSMEPYGDGKDIAGKSYIDAYLWNLCAEGATANALYYWGIGINSYGQHSFTDPHTTTTWNDSHNRAYIMYLATQTKPPSFGSPGEFAYGTYPSGTTYQGDIRDTLNWEASRHASGWANYYYVLSWWNQIASSGALNGDISGDIYNDGRAVVADVNAMYLPNWNTHGQTVNHEIAIVGYDDYNNTYTYIDTCGGPGQDPLVTSGDSCSSPATGYPGAGVYTINQDTLYTAIEKNPYSGGETGNLIW